MLCAGIESGGEGDREHQAMGLGTKADVQIYGFWPSCEISFPVLLFFFEPKSRFLTTPRIYIFRGREAVINDSLRRCGPVKIDSHLGCNSNPREIPRVITRSLLL